MKAFGIRILLHFYESDEEVNEGKFDIKKGMERSLGRPLVCFTSSLIA